MGPIKEIVKLIRKVGVLTVLSGVCIIQNVGLNEERRQNAINQEKLTKYFVEVIENNKKDYIEIVKKQNKVILQCNESNVLLCMKVDKLETRNKELEYEIRNYMLKGRGE